MPCRGSQENGNQFRFVVVSAIVAPVTTIDADPEAMARGPRPFSGIVLIFFKKETPARKAWFAFLYLGKIFKTSFAISFSHFELNVRRDASELHGKPGLYQC